MIHTQTWERRTADVTVGLFLDPLNVRLEGHETSPQIDILQDLFQNEKALDLVEGICKAGYFTHELPVVVERGMELVVVEGNRRVAALKAIQNSNLVPAYQSRIERLAIDAKERQELRVIEVLVAPSQGDANQLVAALHAGGNPRVAWPRPRQAAFFQAQINAGRTFEQLRETYPLTDLRPFIQRSSTLDLFRTVDYEDAELADLMKQGKRIISTLERLYNHPEFQRITGLQVDPNSGTASIRGNPIRFATAAKKIAGDYLSKRVNTRVLERQDDESYLNYLSELEREVDVNCGLSETHDHGSRPNTLNAEFPSSKGADDASSKVEKRRPKKSKTRLDTESLIPITSYLQLQEIFNELADINYTQYPNATYDLLRSFLEKTIKAFADSEGTQVSPKLNKKFVMLGDCFVWLEQRIGSDRSLQQALKIVRGSEQFTDFTSSAEHMNSHNHNFHVCATPSQVKEAWVKVHDEIERSQFHVLPSS
jgi:hypothetical protein